MQTPHERSVLSFHCSGFSLWALSGVVYFLSTPTPVLSHYRFWKCVSFFVSKMEGRPGNQDSAGHVRSHSRPCHPAQLSHKLCRDGAALWRSGAALKGVVAFTFLLTTITPEMWTFPAVTWLHYTLLMGTLGYFKHSSQPILGSEQCKTNEIALQRPKKSLGLSIT